MRLGYRDHCLEQVRLESLCIDQHQTNSAYMAKWCFSLGIVSKF